MFLHLGADTVIPLKNVISINDLRTVKSGINHEFLKTMREEQMIVDISDNNPKSFVLTDKVVYLSAISSLTLKKRAGQIPEEEEE
ncbi:MULTISPECIES: extracellular matrix regulator RemB [Propionispora]|jgi:hypothetical protein|uniref:DUF370 domain-containing protein n=2 Tax=Propionispora TaxID=112902 RepID=A0A1H8XLL2_9FIRM|nr:MULTISPECIES: extracellular matrix/biofilm biosynthesis regulator RemA family protein [Propionispora]SEP40602.1 protein of unknown function [Propionispora vibrioides]SHJ79423.1 protein of unknown function [Propionispora hippei DSM 15287]